MKNLYYKVYWENSYKIESHFSSLTEKRDYILLSIAANIENQLNEFV